MTQYELDEHKLRLAMHEIEIERISILERVRELEAKKLELEKELENLPYKKRMKQRIR